MQENSEKASKIWVFNLILFLIYAVIIFNSGTVNSKESDTREHRIVRDGKGVVENVIIINDKVYFIFEQDKAKEMLIRLENYKKMEEQQEILSRLNSERKAIIEQQNIQINLLNLSNKQNYELASKCGVQETPFYKTSEFMFVSGFVLSTTGYFLYQYGDKL